MRFFLGVLALTISIGAGAAEPLIKVTLLGTGVPRPSIERFSAATLVEAGGVKLLFDSGRGVVQRVWQTKVPFEDLRTVFFTHLQSDHVVGFPDFWLTGWMFGRKSALDVSGPSGTSAMMAHLKKAYAEDLRVRSDEEKKPAAGAEVKAHDIKPGVVFERDGVKVTAFDVDHGLMKPAFGYRVDFRDRAVVLSGDTSYSENLVRHAKGADCIVHEVAFMPAATKDSSAVLAHHSSPDDAAKVFAAVKPKLAVLSHLAIPEGADVEALLAAVQKKYQGAVSVGEDLGVIEIGDTVVFKKSLLPK